MFNRATLQRAARATLNGEPLTSVKGIGPWTASYIAMRSGDRDAFPAGDPCCAAMRAISPSAHCCNARKHGGRFAHTR